MSFGILQRKAEPPKPVKLKKFADLDGGSELVVVIDPTDASQTITPEPNQLLTIEADATRRTFLFDRFSGKANPCAVCDVAQVGPEYKKRVCDHMMCVVNGVRGIEFVQSNGKWTPLSPLRRLEAAVQSRTGKCPDGVELRSSSPSGPSQGRLDRRAEWESALRELETRARAEILQADEFRRKAKRCDKNVKLLRAKIFELLVGGSEKYESSTPLFDFLPKEV